MFCSLHSSPLFSLPFLFSEVRFLFLFLLHARFFFCFLPRSRSSFFVNHFSRSTLVFSRFPPPFIALFFLIMKFFFTSFLIISLFFFVYSAIPAKAQPQLLAAPERRTAAQAQAAAAGGFSMKSTKRFLGGQVPDPARIKHHPTHFWIKLSAMLNIGAGAAYIWWRASRSMPENPVRSVLFCCVSLVFFVFFLCVCFCVFVGFFYFFIFGFFVRRFIRPCICCIMVRSLFFRFVFVFVFFVFFRFCFWSSILVSGAVVPVDRFLPCRSCHYRHCYLSRYRFTYIVPGT